MPTKKSGIHGWRVHETPVAVLDFETTGVNPGTDRVAEVSVLRCEPDSEPQLVLDTLVNPERRMSATEIHGITDDDVADAPTFSEIAGDVVHALSDCVVAAYNVYFDMRFLNYELDRAGCRCAPPHFCLMYMRPMLGLGARCTLGDACRDHGIEHPGMHMSSGDVVASANLYGVYLDEMRERPIHTFGELARLKSYKFTQSFTHTPLSASAFGNLPRGGRFKSRAAVAPEAAGAVDDERSAIGEYWEALKSVLYDLEITDEELEYIEHKKREFPIAAEQVRMLHARAFGMLISQVIDDEWLDDREDCKLRRAYACLQRLGWAPGD